MGQYYTPYLKNKKRKIETYFTHDFDNGLKLMEHSYIDNNMMNQICNAILDNPCQVAWVGDYAEYNDITDKRKINEQDFKKVFTTCNENYLKFKATPQDDLMKFDYEHTYLVNNTSKRFIDLDKYIQNNSTIDDWGNKWCVHPLSLLTAVGNGKGGGDYFGCNTEQVGTWAFDEIYITENKPQDYTEEFYNFKE